MSRRRRGHWSACVNWTQWYVGVWWWPVERNRAFGINLGPLHLLWEKYPDYWGAEKL